MASLRAHCSGCPLTRKQQQRAFSSSVARPLGCPRLPSSAFSNVQNEGVRARAASTESPKIEKLETSYCDEFQCTSSPQIEQTVRTFARDLERHKFTPSFFAKDVAYSDSFRSFTGSATYARPGWVLQSVMKPKTEVKRIQMLDKATAQVDWTLTGQLGAAPLDIDFTSVIEMNLVTGKILSHKDSWDLKRLAGPISFMFNGSRAGWSAKQASMDAQEGLNRVADSISSMTSMDDSGGEIYRDPTDPTKFFQQNQNNQYNDMLNYALIASALWVVYKGFSLVVKL